MFSQSSISVHLMTSTCQSPQYMHSPLMQGSPHHPPCRRRTAVHHQHNSGLPSYRNDQDVCSIQQEKQGARMLPCVTPDQTLYLTAVAPPVTNHLQFSDQSIFHTALNSGMNSILNCKITENSLGDCISIHLVAHQPLSALSSSITPLVFYSKLKAYFFYIVISLGFSAPN